MNKKAKKSKKGKKGKRKNLDVNYNDLNRKDNYVFFELLSTYANQYLDKKDGSTTAPETEKRLR